MYSDLSEMKLSDSQQKIFGGWKRPHDVFRKYFSDNSLHEADVEPTMTAGSEIDLVQDVTADCSVVASLCAAVARNGLGFEQVGKYHAKKLYGHDAE
jgi:calpain-7